MSKILKEHKDKLFVAVIVLVSVLKTAFFDFEYTPYLDDYVQYMYYPFFKNPVSEILFGGPKTAFSRPLAAICDIYFTAPLFSSPSLALLFYTLLYTVSGIVFFAAIKSQTKTAPHVFLIFYLFMPTFVEGTYWISAASRISFGMFFCALSLFKMQKKHFAHFCVCFFCSLCFYEQTALLSFCLVFMLMLSSPREYAKYFVAATVFSAVLVLYYFLLGTKGDNAERLSLSFPSAKEAKTVWLSFCDLLFRAQRPLYTLGFLKGLFIIFAEDKFLRFLLLVLASFCIFLCIEKEKCANFRFQRLACAFLLFFAPLAPFFILKNSAFNFRNLVPSAFGLALATDEILKLFPRAKPALCAVLCFYFVICSVSEIYDRNQTAAYDERIIYYTANQKSAGDTFYYKKEKSDYPAQGSVYNDHIISVTGSDWGLTGTVRAVLKNKDIIVEKN